jgi:hypothetical protein
LKANIMPMPMQSQKQYQQYLHKEIIEIILNFNSGTLLTLLLLSFPLLVS